MTLGDLIRFLKMFEGDRLCTHGFKNPHSYRGFYYKLALEPCEGMTVGSLLKIAESPVGVSYEGHRGRKFTMSLKTGVYLADCDRFGDELSVGMLMDWLGVKD